MILQSNVLMTNLLVAEIYLDENIGEHTVSRSGNFDFMIMYSIKDVVRKVPKIMMLLKHLSRRTQCIRASV